MYLNLPKLGLADLDSILVTSLLNEMTACTFSTSWRPVIIKLYCLNAASRYLDGKQKHTTSGTSCLMAILWAYSKAQLSVNEKQIQSSKIPWLPQKINSESTKNAHQRTLEYISDHRSSLLTQGVTRFHKNVDLQCGWQIPGKTKKLSNIFQLEAQKKLDCTIKEWFLNPLSRYDLHHYLGQFV